SRAVTQRLAAAFEAAGHDVVDARIGNASDHAPFDAAGIPVGGIFTGADDRMSDDQAETTGGVAGEPYDSCYHRDCDTLDQVVTPYVTERLETIGDVAVVVVADLLESLR
ncbi:MAG TPA: M28 family peptidase, partial [Candidatus Avipropionibacterium avicola]|nr:M28 family peptidase [Candidatus Avipropionibacterium avicola]